MVTKLDRIMTYLEWFLPIKWHYDIITWSCKIMWQTKISISKLYTLYKLKTFYLLYHNTYGLQTWQAEYIQWEASFHKVTWFSCCLVILVFLMWFIGLERKRLCRHRLLITPGALFVTSCLLLVTFLLVARHFLLDDLHY